VGKTSAKQNSAMRALNDLGLAAWFGGSLMGAIGLNGAAAEVDHPKERVKVANAGWARWTPANLAAIGAYTVGSLGLTGANRSRLGGQRGVGSAALVKTGLTVAALAATAYSRALGQTLMNAPEPVADGVTEPSAATEPSVADAQRKLRVMQWAVPALTGATLVMDAKLGEQQRPAQVARGVARRLNPAA
jgi:hypothetical protein